MRCSVDLPLTVAPSQKLYVHVHRSECRRRRVNVMFEFEPAFWPCFATIVGSVHNDTDSGIFPLRPPSILVATVVNNARFSQACPSPDQIQKLSSNAPKRRHSILLRTRKHGRSVFNSMAKLCFAYVSRSPAL